MKQSDRAYYTGWGVVFMGIAFAILISLYLGVYVGVLSFALIISALLIVMGIIKKEALPLVIGLFMLVIAIPFLAVALGYEMVYGVIVAFFVAGLILIFLMGGDNIGRH